MAAELVWCSAQFPHPHVNGIFVRMWWQEARITEVRETSDPLSQPSRKGLPAQGRRIHCLGAPLENTFKTNWREGLSCSPIQLPGTTRTKRSITAAGVSPRLGCRPVLSLLRPLMSGSRLRRTFSFLPAFHHLQHPMQSAVWLESAQWKVRSDSVPTILPRHIARMTVIGWILGASNNPAQRAGATPSFLTFWLIESQHLISWNARLVVLVGLPFVPITPTDSRLICCRSCRGP